MVGTWLPRTTSRCGNSNWLMPDFGYWSWPEPKIGSYLEVQMKATAMDTKLAWRKKTNKLIWRGASMELLVREQLVNVSRGHEWGDVKIFSWEEEHEAPLLPASS